MFLKKGVTFCVTETENPPFFSSVFVEKIGFFSIRVV